MKKILTILLGMTIASFATIRNAAAQANEKGMVYQAIKNNKSVTFSNEDNPADVKSAEVTVKASKTNLKAMKANFRAAKSFKTTFKDVNDAMWATGQHTIVAYFKKDDLKTEAVYNKSGQLLHSLTFYPADKTPKDIRSYVENFYPKININLTIQVAENGINFCIVHIEDETTYKEVAIYNGETELLKEYNKIR